jgi:UDP:flavonoid glycosyltransferase YjiC (YdhE family)
LSRATAFLFLEDEERTEGFLKVAVLTFGSRGDIQPLLALAVGLRQAGYEVFLGAPRNFAGLAAEHGVPFRPMSFDISELGRQLGFGRIADKISVWQMARLLRRAPFIADVVNLDAWNLTEDADAIVYRNGVLYAARDIAEARGIPSIEVCLVPKEPSREIPGFLGSGKRRGPTSNLLSSRIVCRAFYVLRRMSANRFRRDILQWPARPRFGGPSTIELEEPRIYGYSPTVIPKPSDWRPQAHVVGYLFLDEPPGWQPPAAVCRFLDVGPRPVFIGFGSVPTANPRQRGSMILEAVHRAGVRAVIHGEWAEAANEQGPPENVLAAGDMPHCWLFPRMAAVVHHGGAGTTADALRAGVPMIVVPHGIDQPFWAHRACDLGVSPEPIPHRRLNADRLAEAIRRATTDSAMQKRAAEIGARIRAEDGIRRSIKLFQKQVERFGIDRSAQRLSAPTSD